MFVDASAIVAILSREVNGKRLVEILDSISIRPRRMGRWIDPA